MLGSSSAHPLSPRGHHIPIVNTQVAFVGKISENMIQDILVEGLGIAHSVSDDLCQDLQTAPVQRKGNFVMRIKMYIPVTAVQSDGGLISSQECIYTRIRALVRTLGSFCRSPCWQAGCRGFGFVHIELYHSDTLYFSQLISANLDAKSPWIHTSQGLGGCRSVPGRRSLPAMPSRLLKSQGQIREFQEHAVPFYRTILQSAVWLHALRPLVSVVVPGPRAVWCQPARRAGAEAQSTVRSSI